MQPARNAPTGPHARARSSVRFSSRTSIRAASPLNRAISRCGPIGPNRGRSLSVPYRFPLHNLSPLPGEFPRAPSRGSSRQSCGWNVVGPSRHINRPTSFFSPRNLPDQFRGVKKRTRDGTGELIWAVCRSPPDAADAGVANHIIAASEEVRLQQRLGGPAGER